MTWHEALQPLGAEVVAVYCPAESLSMDSGYGADPARLMAIWPNDAAALASPPDLLHPAIDAHLEPLLEVGSLDDQVDLHGWRIGTLQSYVRVSFPMVGGRSHLMHFFGKPPGTVDADGVAGVALKHWPAVRLGVQQQLSPLTGIEVRCLKLAFEGLTARESGDLLAMAERTVNAHLQSAMRRLGVNSKTSAIRLAIQFGHF